MFTYQTENKNKNKKINNYYIIHKKNLNKFKKEDIQILLIVKKYAYVVFIKDYKIDIPYIKKFYITKDIYLISKSTITPYYNENDVYNSLYKSLYMQYLHKKIEKDNLLSTYFKSITSNKLIYTNYLIDCGLIYNTKICYNKICYNKIPSTFNNYVIKTPYSLSGECVFFNKINKKIFINNKCLYNNGYILQKYNKSLSITEIRVGVINGDILFVIADDKKIKNRLYYAHKYLEIKNNKEINKLLQIYKKDISTLINKTFYTMNRLVYMYKKKNKSDITLILKTFNKKTENEFNIYIIKLLKKKIHAMSILTCLSINMKNELLNSIIKHLPNKTKDIKILQNILNMKYSDYEKTIKIPKNIIIESYMRIDIALPDNINYNRIYVNEVESFSAGKPDIKYILKSKQNKNFKYLNDLIIHNILKTRKHNIKL